MTVACPDCRSVFRVDPAKVPASGVRARCSVCGAVIPITGGTLPVMVTSASAGVVQAAFATPPESVRAIPTPAPQVSPVATAPPPQLPTPPRPAAADFAAVAARTPTPIATPGIPPTAAAGALQAPPAVAPSTALPSP
ncbi:MAG: zinc-ribbon domain-containing protein, partial [Gemmatimonas sp.]